MRPRPASPDHACELGSDGEPSLAAQPDRETTVGPSPMPDQAGIVICEIQCGRPWYVCELARYAHEPQLRAPALPRARRVRGDARPDDDDAPRRGEPGRPPG